jgi:hypothetical protein
MGVGLMRGGKGTRCTLGYVRPTGPGRWRCRRLLQHKAATATRAWVFPGTFRKLLRNDS